MFISKLILDDIIKYVGDITIIRDLKLLSKDWFEICLNRNNITFLSIPARNYLAPKFVMPFELNTLKNLREFHCSFTRDMTKIPYLPKLRELYCNNSNIRDIPALENLELLHCADTKITDIPYLPKLRELYCNRSSITNIPKLPELKELYCNDTKLLTLSNFPKLEVLHYKNTKITDISFLKNLKYANNTS